MKITKEMIEAFIGSDQNALDGNLDMPTEAPNVIVLSSVAGTA